MSDAAHLDFDTYSGHASGLGFWTAKSLENMTTD